MRSSTLTRLAMVNAVSDEVFEKLSEEYAGRMRCYSIVDVLAMPIFEEVKPRMCFIPIGSEEEARRLAERYTVEGFIEAMDWRELEKAVEWLNENLPRRKRLWETSFEEIARAVGVPGEEEGAVAALVEWLRQRGVRIKEWRYNQDEYKVLPDIMALARLADSDDKIVLVVDRKGAALILLVDDEKEAEKVAKIIGWLETLAKWRAAREEIYRKLGKRQHGSEYARQIMGIVDELLRKHYRYAKKIVYVSKPLLKKPSRGGDEYPTTMYSSYNDLSVAFMCCNGIAIGIGPKVFGEKLPEKLQAVIVAQNLSHNIRDYIMAHPVMRVIGELLEKKAKAKPLLLALPEKLPQQLRREIGSTILLGKRRVAVSTVKELAKIVKGLPMNKEYRFDAVALEGDRAELVEVTLVNTTFGPGVMVVRKTVPHGDIDRDTAALPA